MSREDKVFSRKFALVSILNSVVYVIDRRTRLLMLVTTWHFERRSDRAEHWSRDLNLVTSSAHAAEVEPGWWRGGQEESLQYENLKRKKFVCPRFVYQTPARTPSGKKHDE